MINYHTLSSKAGQVKNHLCQWETITQDPVFMNAIQHYNIAFEETPPLQIVIPKNIIFSASDREIVNNEIAKLLSKGVIEGAHSIPIAPEDRKFIMFEWKGSYFQFTCLPSGLSCAPRIFTKILKPVYAHLRVLSPTCMGHIDDSLLIAQTHNDCVNNIHDKVHLFTKLGSIVLPEK